MATCASSATSMPRVATRVRARIGGGGATGRVALRPRARAVPRAAPVTTTPPRPQASLSTIATTITCRLLPLELIMTILGPFTPVDIVFM